MLALLLWFLGLKDIPDVCEPSLGQEDRFVIMENAEEMEEVSK